MAETTIEWADYTFNPWLGCEKLSPACDHCYAETWAKRAGWPELWQGDRRRTTAANWQQPLVWNRKAERLGKRFRVFCASLADVFDNQVPTRWRDDLWHRIEQTPHLDWLLLTKRPQNIAKMLPDPRSGTKPWAGGWPNVWLGTTVENQDEADRRIPHLLAVPAQVRFLSCEPLLGPVDLTNITAAVPGGPEQWNCLDRTEAAEAEPGAPNTVIDWVIVGGESGPRARPLRAEWVRSLVQQCNAAGVACFVKQMGRKVIDRNDAGFDGSGPTAWDADKLIIEHNIHGYREDYQGADCLVTLADSKGGDMKEWPADLRVREFPNA